MFQKMLDELIKTFPKGKWESETVHIPPTHFYDEFDTKYFFENKTLGYNIVFLKRRYQHIYQLSHSYKTPFHQIKPILFSCLEREAYDLICYEFKKNKPIFYSFGKKSNLMNGLFNSLGSISLSGNGDIYWNHCRLPYVLNFSYLYGECSIEKKQKGEIVEKYTIQTFEDVQTFLSTIEKEKQELVEKEQVFLPFIQSYDATAYFKEETQTYYIFGQSYKIYLKKEDYGYQGRMDGKKINGYTLDEIVEKMKQSIQQLIIKNRTKAVLEGKTLRFTPRFLQHILEKRVSCYRYERYIDSSFTENELNNWLKDHITNCEKVLLSKEELSSIQTFFKERLNKRHKLKTGYRYGKLFVLVSGTKVHVLKPEELKKEAS